MCGRYAFLLPPEAMAQLFRVLNEVVDYPPRYNIAPTQPVITVLEREGRRTAELFRWGFVPGWVKDPRDFPLLIDLYCDDPKAAEIGFLNQGIAFDSHSEPGPDEPTVLTVDARSPELEEFASIHFIVHDHDDLRGALKPDARGESWRGNAAALRRRIEQTEAGS